MGTLQALAGSGLFEWLTRGAWHMASMYSIAANNGFCVTSLFNMREAGMEKVNYIDISHCILGVLSPKKVS